MRSAFKRYKLLKLAMGEEKMPEEGDARDRWIEKSAVLYDLILQSVNNELFQHIKDLVELDDSGPKAWKLLRDVIQPNTLPMVIVLEKELAAFSMRPGDDVKPVLDKIKDTYARMAAAGSKVSQMQQCTKIISVLDNSWDNLIPTLNTQQDQWTPDWLRQQILQEDFRRRHTGGGAANKTAEGYGAAGGSRGRGGGRGRGPTAATATATTATAAPMYYTAMASLRVLAFDHEGRLVHFDTWLDDLQLYLLSDSTKCVSLFDLASGAASAPPSTADSSTHSQWLTRDAAACLAIRNHLPLAECAHFGQHRTTQALYDAVVARYSSHTTAALGRLLLPYLFPELSAFATIEDLVSHLCASDARYRATVSAEFLDRNSPSIAVAVGAARRTPRPPFFEGCFPSPLAPSYASAAAADVSIPEDVRAASASAKRGNSKGKGGRGGGGGSGGGGGGRRSGGGGSSGGGGGGGSCGSGGSGGGSGGSGGGGGGNGGSGGSGGGGTGARRVGSGGGQRQQQQRRSETLSLQQLREWFLRGSSGGICPYVICTGDHAGQTCVRLHTQHRCFSRLDDAWRAEFGDDVELPRWADLLKSRIGIFDLDFDAILSTMYALSVSVEGDCYQCVPPDPRTATAALGASEFGTLPGIASTEAFHTFTLDSGASRCFFCDSTTLTPLPAPIPQELQQQELLQQQQQHKSVLQQLFQPVSGFWTLSLPSSFPDHSPPPTPYTLPPLDLSLAVFSPPRSHSSPPVVPHVWTVRCPARTHPSIACTGFAPSIAKPVTVSTHRHFAASVLRPRVLQRIGFQYSSPKSTPLPTGQSLLAPPSDKSVEPGGPYPELVGCLMYLMTCTRPDLAYSLSILARYVAPERHRPEHWEAAKRVLRYLCSTSGMGLVLGGRGLVVLTGHADASWGHGYTGATLAHLPADLLGRVASFASSSQRGHLRLAYVAIRANTADIFTKALQSGDHQHFSTVVGLCDRADGLSLFDLTSGASPPPPATADSTVRSQWATCDAAARLAVRRHLPTTERVHFSQYKSAQTLYDAVVARYSSPATAALSRLILPYLFLDLSAFSTVADLITHLRTSDNRYCAALPAEFCAQNPPPMYITLYYIVTRLPDSLRLVRDHFLSVCPTTLTVDLLEQRLLASETSIVAVGASRGDPRTPVFEGCSPSPLLPSVASAATADLGGFESFGAASAPSRRRRTGKGKGGKGTGGTDGGGGGGGGGSGGGVGATLRFAFGLLSVCVHACVHGMQASAVDMAVEGAEDEEEEGLEAATSTEAAGVADTAMTTRTTDAVADGSVASVIFATRADTCGAIATNSLMDGLLLKAKRVEEQKEGEEEVVEAVAVAEVVLQRRMKALRSQQLWGRSPYTPWTIGGLGGGGRGGGGGGVGSSSGGGGGGGGGGGSGGGGGGGVDGGGGGGGDGGGSGGAGRGSTQRSGSGGGQRQQQQRSRETPSPYQLREWYAGHQRGGGTGLCTYVLCTGDRAGEQCGGLHSTQRCFGRLTDAWRHLFPDATEIPRWGDLSRAGVSIFDLDYDAIFAAMYAVSSSDEGECYLCLPPDPGVEAAPLGAGETPALGASASPAPGAGESALSGTASAQVFHTFTLDSGASRSFFRDRTTLTPLRRPVAVSLADPSRGPVLASFSTVLPCPAAPSGTLSGLYLPSFSTNLVSGADLQDQGVDQFKPASQRVTHCTCARTGRHLATFTHRPGSSLYTLSTESPSVPASDQVAASSQVFVAASGSGPESAPCSCRLVSHQTLLWHHRLGHPSLPRLRGMASRVLVSGLPRSLPPLPPGPAPTCIPCVEGRQRAASHSSEFPPTEAPLQTLHMDVWGPAHVHGQGHERYFLLVVDDYSRYTTVFPLRSKGDVAEVGGEFSSARLGAFCRAQGIRQTFMLPASPQQNGIAERRIGMVVDVAPQPSAPGLCTKDPLPPQGPAPSGVSQVDAVEPVEVAVDSGAARGAEPVGAGSMGAGSGGAEPGVAESGGAEPEGAEPGGAESGGTEPGGAEPGGAESARVASHSASSRRELLSPQELREWFARRWSRAAGAGGPPVTPSPGGARTCGTGAVGTGGAAAATGVGPAGASGAAGAGALGGVGAGLGAAGASGAAGAGATGGVGAGVGPIGGAAGGAGSTGAAGPSGDGAVGAEGAASAGAAPRGTGAVLGLPPSPGPAPPLECPQPVESQSQLQPVSPLPAPSLYAGPTGGLVERREPASRPAPRHTPDDAASFYAPLCVPLPSPPASSLPVLADPATDSLRAASPTVACLLSTVVTDPSFESTTASALVAELVDFAARCRLDYTARLVAASESVCPPSVAGECALSTDVLEDRQEEFQCFAAALPHLVSTLIAPEGDPDAPDIPTPRSYAEAIEGPYSSQSQSAMDAEMASWMSTGTYVDEVPPPGANIVSGMWIFRVKRPPGSPPVFKARYVARGFSQRQGVDYFQTFSPTPKMTTLRVSASGLVVAPCSCCLLSHQTLLWHRHLGHPSMPRLRGMHSRLLVSGLPRSLPPLPPSPAPPYLPCVEGRQRAAPHSSFPLTSAPLQTLHMDVRGPGRVSGQDHERYFLLVVDDYTRYTTVFPLRSKGEVPVVLIPWIRAVRLQLRERFRDDLLVLRLHSVRGGEFSPDLLWDFGRGESILQSITLPASLQQNGVAEHRIGLVMELARTSMIHAAAPHFLWMFTV
ncbi:unnamed protein product [Closterium sp. NIES-53]